MKLFMNVFGGIDYIMCVFWYISTDGVCINAFALMFSVLGDMFWTCDT